MYRIVQRLKVNNNLKVTNFRSFCNFECESGIALDNTTSKNDLGTYHDYFVNSDRYESFRKNSVILHEFDDETNKLTVWTKTSSANSVHWNNLPQELSNDDLIQALTNMIECSVVISGINLSNPTYDCFVDEFLKKLAEFTLNEIVRTIQIFARFSMDKYSVRQRNFIEIYMALDQEMSIRSANLDLDQLLFLCSIWRCIPLAKDSFFSSLLAELFNRYFKIMDAKQLAQATHFINDMKKRLKNVPDFENIIDTALDTDMNLEELSLILWKFNKCEMKIQKKDFKRKLYDYLEARDLNQLQDRYLIHFSNILTNNLSDEQSGQLKNILKNLHETFSYRSLRNCFHIANIGTSIRIFNDEIMFDLFDRCLRHSNALSDATISDLKLLSELISFYSGDVEQRTAIGHLILKDLRNRLEYVANQNFHDYFIEIIRNLIVRDIYDFEMLDNIFRSDYIKQVYKNRKQLRGAMYEIDGYARINLRNIYHGNLLSGELLEKFKYFGTHIPDQVHRHKVSESFVYAIEMVIKRLFNHYQYAHAISHHRQADNFVCIIRKSLDSVNVSERFPKLYTGKVFDANRITQNDPDLMVFAFVAGNIKDKFNSCESFAFSNLNLKLQQLKILGFHPILIPPTTQGSLHKFIIEKINETFKDLGIDGPKSKHPIWNKNNHN